MVYSDNQSTHAQALQNNRVSFAPRNQSPAAYRGTDLSSSTRNFEPDRAGNHGLIT